MIASDDFRKLKRELTMSRRHILIPATKSSPGLLSSGRPEGPVAIGRERLRDDITLAT
jgi:hypothetical protein